MSPASCTTQSVHPIDWKYEIFWVLFSPVIRIHVKFLPPITKPTDNDQKIDDFIENVREEIAKNLDATLSSMDKNKFWLMSDDRSMAVSEPVNAVSTGSSVLLSSKGDL